MYVLTRSTVRRVLGTNPSPGGTRADSIDWETSETPHDGEVDDGVGAGILRGADHVWRRLIAVDWRARTAGSGSMAAMTSVAPSSAGTSAA